MRESNFGRPTPYGGVERERRGHFRRPRARRVAGAGLEVAELDGAAAAVVARGVAHCVFHWFSGFLFLVTFYCGSRRPVLGVLLILIGRLGYANQTV